MKIFLKERVTLFGYSLTNHVFFSKKTDTIFLSVRPFNTMELSFVKLNSYKIKTKSDRISNNFSF